ncbi:MBL fold metallo-hydrolase [Halorubrum sp. JWXQ-INN 858]|uniref:MBL fold metallo-hydrolase n=1 Tax=Halorubrum sp. JWXQ-INN 858 TaxID=2690782 RepID=UPI00135AA4E4|nr:rhodanese-like domain-containing protein [Halorubrum sp. JWXQ-INN 858]MWV65565.1 MBL fold metallo-hydrolase [Halorubrum sp. JWXQ-INN 858]
MVTVVSAETFRDMVDERRRGERSFTVVDTREAESYEGWRVADALHYFYKPFHEFDVEAFERETGLGPDDAVVTMCAVGKASTDLADALATAGYDDVTVVEDGMHGWSGVYDRVAVPLPDVEEGPLDVIQVQRRAKGCLGYLIVGGVSERAGEDGNADRRAAVAVDVSRHGAEWRRAAEDLDAAIVGVLDTHVHADHLSGGRALADDLGVPYYLPAAAAARDVADGFEPIARNEALDVGGVDVKALATPGHTDDMASYLVGRSAVLTGDTLFTEGVGRTELQFAADDADTEAADADAEAAAAAAGAGKLYDSLHATLLAEPDDVVVLPGHFTVESDGTTGGAVPGEPVVTTVGDARVGIDVLGLDREAFVDRITATLPEKPPNYAAIIAANRGVDAPEDETAAIELELGPNRCAAEAPPESNADD